MERNSVEGLGKYEYDNKERLGFGAFAIVFKGWYKNNPSVEVAIKSIAKKNLAKSQSLLDKEIKILRELTELQHENVVALLECIDHPTHVYLVMEFCNGGDLQDYLVAQKSLSETTIRLFTQQLAGAMQALYAKGILHRDLKPQNILLKYEVNDYRDRGRKRYPRPEEITLKIADFGFARFLSDGVMAATMCGSPMYMAPEVIMSLRYDAKADLWSLGTIIYQCLVGNAPFSATTPAGLKQIYEKHTNLTPSFPESTSDDLKDLLLRMLKRNSNERISFDEFFNHRFLKPPPEPSLPKPVSVSPRDHGRRNFYVDPLEKLKPHCLYDITACENVDTQCSKISNLSFVSSLTSDDFVMVPSNLPTTDKYCSRYAENASPPRPSTLYIQPRLDAPQSPRKASLPRSHTHPIKIDRQASIISDINVNSISPPSVQFVLGTPPLSRRPSDSSTGRCSPSWALTPTSPLRRSVVSSPLLASPFTTFTFPKSSTFHTRAVTLPEMKNVGTAMGFVYPELHEGKLFPREHTEILTKLNFVMVLVECIGECASPARDRCERLVLLVRILQLLSCGLNLSIKELQAGRLQPSKNVKNVVKRLNEKFHKCLADCKKLNTPSVLQKVSATADKILYNYAIEMCQKAALDELQNNIAQCFKRYQTAQIVLHGLAQQINHPQDKAMLSKYRSAVEKRLALLQGKQHYLMEGDSEQHENNNDLTKGFQ